jgi:hypothetical protein
MDQFLCMAFAQLTCRESLRDIESCLRSVKPKLYHMGIRSRIAKSTLADANEKRDWQIYSDFANILIQKARELYKNDDLGLELAQSVYALDATTIDLCLSLFPWAEFRKHKAAVKMHALIDLRGNIPSFVRITTGKVHDVKILDNLILEPGSFYVMDRAYVDFARLNKFELHKAFFVTRAKTNLNFRRLYSQVVDRSTGLICDQTIVLTGFYVSKKYPEKLRRIRYYDKETDNTLVFLTNNFLLSAQTICYLYKDRWQVELFFKWIKQHLRIKSFYGTSLNAVKTQIWIAISVYVLVAIIKKQLKIELSLYTMLQILSLTLFERTPLLEILQKFSESDVEKNSRQLSLFENPEQFYMMRNILSTQKPCEFL